jgi:hypothetical protein
VLLELEVLAVPVPQEFRFWAGVRKWKKEEGRRKREEAVPSSTTSPTSTTTSWLK